MVSDGCGHEHWDKIYVFNLWFKLCEELNQAICLSA